MTTDVVIPARNEEATIAYVLPPFLTHKGVNRTILVIDPDTTDRTKELALEICDEYGAANAWAIVDSPEPGKGQGARAGLNHVVTPRVAFCDADVTGLQWEHVSRLIAPPPPPYGQTILVPRYPVNVPHHVIEAWPWVSGERALPTWVALRPELHGYLMEYQLNNAVKTAGFKTRFLFEDRVVSPFNITPKRLEEMERDRAWGLTHEVFNATPDK